MPLGPLLLDASSMYQPIVTTICPGSRKARLSERNFPQRREEKSRKYFYTSSYALHTGKRSDDDTHDLTTVARLETDTSPFPGSRVTVDVSAFVLHVKRELELGRSRMAGVQPWCALLSGIDKPPLSE